MLFNACSDDTDDIIDDENNNGNDITVDLNHADFVALKTVGGFAYKGDIIIVRSSESAYIALSKICTHQGCTVAFNSSGNDLVCPCHGSKFSISGTVTNGPAATNLKQYSVKVTGNTLTIS
jgi:cytochrome b6-f complex iron-sulfur subunit